VDAAAGNIETARVFIDGLSSGGGTELLSGIQAALSSPMTTEHQRIYIFLTDGFITNEEAIFQELRTHPSNPTVFTFGAGNSLNRYFLDEAAKIGNGFSTEITENELVEPKVDEAWNKIESPQLKNISISFGNLQVYDVISPVSGNLFIGLPYTVFGKYSGGGTFTVTLSGYREGEPFSLEKQITFANARNISHMLPQIWAKQRISRLSIEEGTTEANKGQIIEISKAYQVMSKYTAFLAIQPQPIGDDESIKDDIINTTSTMEDGFNLNDMLTLSMLDGYLWVHLPPEQMLLSIRVYDINGKVLFEWTQGTTSETGSSFKWDGRRLNGALLKPGRYFIQVQTNTGTVVKMFTWIG
jgi:Ca-activated chloride channel family protein